MPPGPVLQVRVGPRPLAAFPSYWNGPHPGARPDTVKLVPARIYVPNVPIDFTVPMLTFATKKHSTGAHGQKEDAASAFDCADWIELLCWQAKSRARASSWSAGPAPPSCRARLSST